MPRGDSLIPFDLIESSHGAPKGARHLSAPCGLFELLASKPKAAMSTKERSAAMPSL